MIRLISRVWMTHDLDPEIQLRLQTCRLAAPRRLRFLQGHLVLLVFFPMNCIFVVNKSLRTCFLRMSTNIIDMQAAAEEAEKELEARHLTFRQRVCMIKVKQHFLGEETP